MPLLDSIVSIQADLKSIRRDIHAHPELCYEERRTSRIVKEKLEEWEIPVVTGLGITGVIGIIKNGRSPRAIGLRADMDALPMHEANTFPHASVYEGKMHACGHDGHTAMLLGAAYYLSRNRNFDGTVYVIFQPAEEGGGGAKRMIDDGLFDVCPMDAVFGMHNMPNAPVGTFHVRKGAMLASSSQFDLIVKGKGGHAAQPDKAVDPITVAIQIAHAWQTIISQNKDPTLPAVLAITQMQAGTAINIIPDQAAVRGTVRTFSADVLDMIENRMRTAAENISAAFSAEVKFTFTRSYPPLVNHTAETELAVRVMQAVVGVNNVHLISEPVMGSEDFAFMLHEKPGCYVLIGGNDDRGQFQTCNASPCELHNPFYDFNDEIIPIGSTYWVRLVEEYLGGTNSIERSTCA